MSGGLAPSKSTVYASNLPFSLTNNDLHKIFEKFGRVAKVTIQKDKDKRQSKGVAFVLFIERESAYKCVQALNNTLMFGRTIKCSIAKDNGRAPEFIRRKVYKDKTKCYECGEEGHLSYCCPHNKLGDREPPPKKDKKKNKSGETSVEGGAASDVSESEENETYTAAIQYQAQLASSEAGYDFGECSEPKRKKYKKDDYFSDEEELND